MMKPEWAVASDERVEISSSEAGPHEADRGEVLCPGAPVNGADRGEISKSPSKASDVTSSPGQSPDMGAPSPQPCQNPFASAGRRGRGDVSAVCGDDVDPAAISTRGPPRPTARPQQDPQLGPQERLQAAAEPEPVRGRNESSLDFLLRFIRYHRSGSNMTDTEFIFGALLHACAWERIGADNALANERSPAGKEATRQAILEQVAI